MALDGLKKQNRSNNQPDARHEASEKDLQKAIGGSKVVIKKQKVEEATAPLQVTIPEKMCRDFKAEARRMGRKNYEHFMKVYNFYLKHRDKLGEIED